MMLLLMIMIIIIIIIIITIIIIIIIMINDYRERGERAVINGYYKPARTWRP